MTQSTNVCMICGQAARVRILANYVGGEPAFQHYCFQCADHYLGQQVAAPAAPRRVSIGSLIILAGTTFGLLGLAADHLGIHGNPGFGWYKRSALAAGSLLVCLGSFWRIDVLGVIGILLFLAAASANVLGLAGREGFGFKQQLAVAAGLVLIAAGMALRTRSSRRRAPS
jgi:hypothetical protein